MTDIGGLQEQRTHYAQVRARLLSAPELPPALPPPALPPPTLPCPTIRHRIVIPQYKLVYLDQPARPTFDGIMAEVAAFYGFGINELMSDRRDAKLVHARHMAIHIMRKVTTLSFPTIAKKMGGRDHTTILHAAHKMRKIEDSGDEGFLAQVKEINAALEKRASQVWRAR